jgi:hypothetical protein
MPKINKSLIWLFLSLIVSIFSFSGLLRPGYFPMHDDMQAMRVYEMDKCVHDMQIPCRWVPDMGYGYGYPQFNYYPPTPYYIMETLHLFGMSVLGSVKTGIILSFILSAAFMFLLGKELFGDVGGFVSSVFYIYNPYRATDVYNRGAMGEFWALVFLPLIFLAILKIVKKPSKTNALLLALSYAGLLTTHLVTSLIFTPVAIAWGIFLIIFFSIKRGSILSSKIFSFKDKMDRLMVLAGGAFWGLFLSGFFVLPVIFERKYAHTETMIEGFFNYLAHFVSIRQMFTSTHWGFGSSELGPYDDFSFSIGIFHWIFGAISVLVAFLYRKKNDLMYKMSLFFLFVFLAASFMAHQRSSFIWKLAPILEYLQFPWRFLVISVFSVSLLAGLFTFFLKGSKKNTVLGLVSAGVIIFFNVFYFYPRTWYDITDVEKFSGDLWEKQQTISIFDYLPIYAQAPPAQRAPAEPEVVSGSAEVLSGQHGSDWYKWNLQVDSKTAKIKLPVFDFPGWKVFVDEKRVETNHDNDLGLITFEVTSGEHGVYAKLTNSSVRTVGNIFSLLGIAAIPVVLRGVKGKRKK